MFWRNTVQLGYSEAQSNKGKNSLAAWSAAVFLGMGAFAAFISAIGLTYSQKTMMSGNPVSGLIYAWNAAADKLGNTDFIIIGKYACQDSAHGMFLTMVLIINVLVAYLILQSKVKWLLLIYIVPLAAAELFWNIGPEMTQGMFLAAALGIAFISMSNQDAALHWPQILGLTASVIIAAIAVLALSGTVTLTEPTSLQKCGNYVISYANDLRYGTNEGLCNGQLNRLNSRSAGSDTALTVKMSRPQSMYLRGYIGEVYMGNEWTHLSNRTYYSARDKLYWLNKNGFSGLTQLAESEKLAGGNTEAETVRVTIKNADRRNLYVPYELTDGIVEGGNSCADGYLAAEGVAGVSGYCFQMADNLTGSWTDWASKLYSHKRNNSISKYFVCESHYNVFQYQHYLGIPDNIKTLLKKEIGDQGYQGKSHLNYKTAIHNVHTYLEDNFVYSEHFKDLKSSEDFAENFVKKHRGCDIHYATMATLIFRYYGIPARYVEGYLVTPADAEKATAGRSIDVKQNRIHAWTEIYVDGYGWVPIEVTPKYYGIMKTADMTKGLESSNYQDQLNVSRDNGQGTEKNSDESQQSRKLLIFIFKISLCCVSMLLIILLAVYIAKRLMAAASQRRIFCGPDFRKSICAIYASMLAKGFDIGEKAEAIGNYAAYSRGIVTEEQRSFMLDEFMRSKGEKKKADRKNKRDSIMRCAGSLHRLQRRHWRE